MTEFPSEESSKTRAPRRRRPPPPPKNRWQRMPVTIRVSIVLGLIAPIVLAIVNSVPIPILIRLIDESGQPLKACDLDFYEYNDAGWGPSPAVRLDEQKYEGQNGVVTLKAGLPDELLVKLSSAELGVMFTAVTRGEPIRDIRFGVSESQTGTVVLPDGKPAVGGRVQVLLGGSRGFLLSETETDANGQFRVENFSSLTGSSSKGADVKGGRSIGVRSLHVRALVPGYEVFEWDRSVIEPRPFRIELIPTRPVTGTVSTKHDLSVAGLEMRSYGLPGVTSRTAGDGSFSFDNLPGGYLRPTLFLPGLPAGYTHRMCKVEAGDRGVNIEVFRSATIRGQVLNGSSRLPVVGAKVMHEHGPFGKQIVETDSNGEFEIPNVPPGVINFIADILIRRKGGVAVVRGFDMRDQPAHIRRVIVQGSQSIKVSEGVDQDGAVILMY